MVFSRSLKEVGEGEGGLLDRSPATRGTRFFFGWDGLKGTKRKKGIKLRRIFFTRRGACCGQRTVLLIIQRVIFPIIYMEQMLEAGQLDMVVHGLECPICN